MKKNSFYYILIVILAIAIVIVTIKGINKNTETSVQPTEMSKVDSIEESEANPDPNPIFTTEHVVSAELIQEGLQDMGFLITQEYDCTGVLNNSKVKSILGINLPFTESSYLFSYDATVEAGIDFTAITVEQDEGIMEIIIHLPEAQVGSISIDPDSFTKYEEKDGLGTKMTITDYNESLQQFEETVKAKAIEKGLLEKASANAEIVVMNFVKSLVNNTDYHIVID